MAIQQIEKEKEMNEMLKEITDLESTIVAISTPAGTGGIAVVRISGKEALRIADEVWTGKSLREAETHTVHLGTVLDTNGRPLDTCVATVYRAPKSYTGQNTVEFSVHGSLYIQKELLQSLILRGARMAMPGEFTRRAFANGRLKLTQAEAVADIIASDSRAAHRLAMSQLKGSFQKRIDELREKLLNLVSLMELELDFSDEDVEFADREVLRSHLTEIIDHISRLLASFKTGNAIKNGIPVAIVGPTNAGKSSLLNAIVGHDRAIVSQYHGTTRDTIEETAEIEDYLFRFIDTAGLRDTDDPVEKIGISRSHEALERAYIVIAVVDASDPAKGLTLAQDIACKIDQGKSLLIALNKTDLTPTGSLTEFDSATILRDNINSSERDFSIITLSAKTGEGIDKLRKAMAEITERRLNPRGTEDTDSVLVTNQRHAASLSKALNAAEKLLAGLNDGVSTDLLAIDAHDILDALAELTGAITPSAVLENIFSHFCIGK